jgi:hypothetical protein
MTAALPLSRLAGKRMEGLSNLQWYDDLVYKEMTVVKCPLCNSRNNVDSRDIDAKMT